MIFGDDKPGCPLVLGGFGRYGQAAEAAAVTSSEAAGPGHQSNLRSIILGVGTGLAVWAITRVLDAHFLPKKRS